MDVVSTNSVATTACVHLVVMVVGLLVVGARRLKQMRYVPHDHCSPGCARPVWTPISATPSLADSHVGETIRISHPLALLIGRLAVKADWIVRNFSVESDCCAARCHQN
jgi:hypothetical protein